VARASERRWVPASAGTTELCKSSWSSVMLHDFVERQ
jgi:hypothetical protein